MGTTLVLQGQLYSTGGTRQIYLLSWDWCPWYIHWEKSLGVLTFFSGQYGKHDFVSFLELGTLL